MHRLSGTVAWIFINLGVLGSVLPAAAVDHCKNTVSRSDGTIFVKAKGISGTPLWGDALGQEINPFFNGGSCVRAPRPPVGPPGPPGPRPAPPPRVGAAAPLQHDRPPPAPAASPAAPPPPPFLPCSLSPPTNLCTPDKPDAPTSDPLSPL